MKYVSPEYQERLDELADLLCTPERYGEVAKDVGQLALFELVEKPLEQDNDVL